MTDHYRRLFELSDEILCVCDADGIVDANASFERTLGYTLSELRANPEVNVVHPADRERADHVTQRLLEGGPPTENEFRYLRKNGEIAYMRWRAYFSPNDKKIYASARDITALRQNAEELAEKNIRLKLALRAAKMGTWAVELATDTVDWSVEAYEICGVPADTPMTTARFFDVIHPEDRARVVAAATAVIERGEKYDVEFRVTWPDGSVHWVHSQGDVFYQRDHDLSTARIVGTVHNIDTRKQLEFERNEFLSIAAHELKTPLTPLLLGVDLIDQTLRADSNPRTLQIIDTFRRQVTRLSRLVTELLDLGRAQTQRIELKKTEIRIAELIRSVVKQFEAQLQDASIGPTLQGPEELKIECDSFRLEQVLVNLVANALKYAPGSPLEIHWLSEGKDVAIRVCDRGPGVPEHERARIFEKFARASSYRHFGGMGLGLFISRSIVEAHGGSIHCESDPGRLTTFTVRLPARL